MHIDHCQVIGPGPLSREVISMGTRVYTLRIEPHSPIRASDRNFHSPGSNSTRPDGTRILNVHLFS